MANSVWGRWVLTAVVAMWGGAGCTEETDLGKECTLVSRGPSGDREAILNRDLRPGQEVISFGTTECDNLICVRDADFVGTSNAPGDPAKGYCSTDCTPPTGPLATDQCLTGNAQTDAPDSGTRLTCRPVLLEPAVLAALQANDPELYKRFFGDTAGGQFCSRGDGRPDAPAGADGGTSP
jgi:hypothetical protein